MLLAKWESRGKAHYVELYQDGISYNFRGNDCGGCLGSIETVEMAVAIMQRKVESGYFLPDNAILPMKRVV